MSALRVLAGRYELVRCVGRGGMGEVWEARDRVIARRVAVKLLPHQAGDTRSADLFFREARTAGALHHPGIVTALDMGRDDADETLFLVLEFVEGRDLSTVLRSDGAPPVSTAVDWVAQVAAALARTHARGVVHRDLKPSNLMLTDDGVVKILDFGIARFMESTTGSSKVMGTLAYMPPERFAEQPGDARSDLYSLGCVLHELLTGKVPFEVRGPIAMMNAHLLRAPSAPGEHRPDVPAALDDLVLALLAKDPNERPATADEVHRRLHALTAAPGDDDSDATSGAPWPEVLEPLPGRRRFLRTAVVGATVGATVGGITAAFALRSTGTDSDTPKADSPRTPTNSAGAPDGVATRPEAPRPKERWTNAMVGAIGSRPAVADGMVYIGSNDKNVYALDAATGVRIWSFVSGGAVNSSPAVAGETVYVGSDDHNVYALDARTGTEKWSFKAGGPFGYMAPLPAPAVADGVVYIGCYDKNVYALDARTGTEKWAYTTGALVDSSPMVADGVVYIGSSDTHIYALDAATGVEKWSYATGGAVHSSPAVMDGTLYVGSDDGVVYALVAATGAKKWVHLTKDRVTASPVVVDGVVYISSLDQNVYVLDAATGTRTWTYLMRSSITLSPAVAGGMMYGGSEFDVYAWNAATGSQKWSYATDAPVTSPPTVVGEMLYIGTGRGVLALDTRTSSA